MGKKERQELCDKLTKENKVVREDLMRRLGEIMDGMTVKELEFLTGYLVERQHLGGWKTPDGRLVAPVRIVSQTVMESAFTK